MYGNLRSKLELQEENFPFSLTLKESSLTMRSFLCPRLSVYNLDFRQRVLLLLWNISRVTVFLQFSKQLSEEVHLFVSKLTLQSSK